MRNGTPVEVDGSKDSRSEDKTSGYRPTINFHELSAWRKDNDYIVRGYRRDLPSYPLIVHSIYAYWHNETVNIWSHLIGAVIAILSLLSLSFLSSGDLSHDTARIGLYAPLYLVSPFASIELPSVTWVDSLVIGIFFLSATACLGFSSAFHALSCHSEQVSKRWHRLDYIGISLLISGTFVPSVTFGFYCSKALRLFYLGLIATSTSATIYVTLSPLTSTPAYRRFRTFVFIGLGASAVFPIAHGVALYGFEHASKLFSLPWLAAGGALYIAGALLYAERCPERFSRGRFDMVGSSHQLFHVAIVFAAWCHYTAISEAFRYRHGEMNGVC